MAERENVGFIAGGNVTAGRDVIGIRHGDTVERPAPAGRRADPPAGDVDVLIITALREEFDAARTARNGVASWQQHDRDGTAPYLTGGYRTAAGEWISVALARPVLMGGRNTGPIATTLTDLLRPACLAMSGVCAGNPDDTTPGDVVVAAPAFEYDEGKHTGTAFQGDQHQYPQDNRWLRAAQDLDPAVLPSYGEAGEDEAAAWFLERLHQGRNPRTHPARNRYVPLATWQPRLAKLEADGLIVWLNGRWELTGAGTARIQRLLAEDVAGPEHLPFAVHAGPMASGSTVIAQPGIWDRIKDLGVRKVAALEMEAATIATVAHDRRVPHWLVAKGVMDHADFAKDDRFKRFAARASAEVLYELLGQLVPATVRPARPAGSSRRTATTGEIPGAVKLDVIRRLHFNWQDLADLVGVPPYETRRFDRGDEPRRLWEWLESRGRLPGLPAALDEIGRSDLAALLREHQAPG
jgi:nucleoside phosphorylase